MACHPHYIRCIRPNGQKLAKNFDMQLSTNQVRYLGLLENVRVRRAGFAYRTTYERFMWRYFIYYLLIFIYYFYILLVYFLFFIIIIILLLFYYFYYFIILLVFYYFYLFYILLLLLFI